MVTLAGCRLLCTPTPAGCSLLISSRVALQVLTKTPIDQLTDRPDSAGFVVTVASLMEMRTYTSTETMYNAGDVVTNMYVVNKGMVAKSGQILSAGKLLGMEMTYMMLYRPVKYVETAKVPLACCNALSEPCCCQALSYADLYALSWTKFRNCLEEYPRVFPQVYASPLRVCVW